MISGSEGENTRVCEVNVCSTQNCSHAGVFVVAEHEANDISLFWELEEVQRQVSSRTLEELACEAFYDQTTFHDAENRTVVFFAF